MTDNGGFSKYSSCFLRVIYYCHFDVLTTSSPTHFWVFSHISMAYSWDILAILPNFLEFEVAYWSYYCLGHWRIFSTTFQFNIIDLGNFFIWMMKELKLLLYMQVMNLWTGKVKSPVCLRWNNVIYFCFFLNKSRS